MVGTVTGTFLTGDELLAVVDHVDGLSKGRRLPSWSGRVVVGNDVIVVIVTFSCGGKIAPMDVSSLRNVDYVVNGSLVPNWPPLDAWVRGTSDAARRIDIAFWPEGFLIVTLLAIELDGGLLHHFGESCTEHSRLLR